MRKKFSKLDKNVLTILVVVFIPLSLWGGAEHWAGNTGYLPFIMLLIGAGFVVFESVRLCSPLISGLLGALLPLISIGPSLFLFPVGGGGLFVVVAIGLFFGLIASVVSWFARKQRTPAVVMLHEMKKLGFIALMLVLGFFTYWGFAWFCADWDITYAPIRTLSDVTNAIGETAFCNIAIIGSIGFPIYIVLYFAVLRKKFQKPPNNDE